MGQASYKVSEARAHFSELLQRAQAGEDILITHGSKPIARLVPVEKQVKRAPGALRAFLTEAEIDALSEAIEAPLPAADQRILEGEGTDEVGIWIDLPEEREDDSRGTEREKGNK